RHPVRANVLELETILGGEVEQKSLPSTRATTGVLGPISRPSRETVAETPSTNASPTGSPEMVERSLQCAHAHELACRVPHTCAWPPLAPANSMCWLPNPIVPSRDTSAFGSTSAVLAMRSLWSTG